MTLTSSSLEFAIQTCFLICVDVAGSPRSKIVCAL